MSNQFLIFSFTFLIALVRVQRCGKSAPAVSRGAGSVNPGWEQGDRNYGWSFTSSAQREPLEAFGNKRPR